MKLLFDQNIFFRIVDRIQSIFPDSKQVRLLQMEDVADIEIWHYAKANDFTIVKSDADFADIANIKGCPPKIIWLRTGNMKTNNIIEILDHNQKIINEFYVNLEYKEVACLEIG